MAPDECLLELRNMGPSRLTELRAQIPYAPLTVDTDRSVGTCYESAARLAPATGDPFGVVLRRCYDAGAIAGREAVIVERDDGYLSATDATRYVHTGAADYLEREALSWVRGDVLDVGCGAGRFGLELSSRGHTVYGVDTSPGAIGVTRARGLRGQCASYLDPLSDLTPADTVIMLGQGVQLLGAASTPAAGLERLAELVAPGGRLIIDGTDPYATADPEHLAYLEHARQNGRPGRIRIRVRDRASCSAWAELSLLSADETVQLSLTGPWRLEHRTAGDAGAWMLVLGRLPSP